MDPERNALIGERVRFYRTSKEMSMEKLCESLPTKITLQQMARYETNLSRWPADLLCEVATALGIDVRLLLAEDGKRKAPKGEEWEAEKYKNDILKLPEKSRRMVYNMIDGLAGE